MKNLIAQFKNCFTRSDIYEKPESNSPGAAIGYIALVLVVTTVIKGAIIGTVMIPMFGEFKDFALQALAEYPANLTLTMNKGILSTDPAGSVALPLEAKFATTTFQNLAVIDASKDVSIDSFSSYKTYVLIARNGMITADKNGALKVQTYSGFPDGSLTKATVDKILVKARAFSPLAYLLGVFVSVLVTLMMYAFALAGALVAALVGVIASLVVTRLKGHKLGFKELYALSLYAYTLVAVINLASFAIVAIPAWISLVAYVALLAVLVGKKSTATPEDAPQATA